MHPMRRLFGSGRWWTSRLSAKGITKIWSGRSPRVPALTLMELLVVLAIIGIIVLLALPNFMGVVSDARAMEAQQQLRHLYSLQKTQFFKAAAYSVNSAPY